MVEKFKKILSAIETERGSVNLLALLKMDEFTDKWSVILSASWAKESNIDDFKYFLRVVRANLSPQELLTIARVGISSREEHLIDLLLRYSTDAHILNEKINGNQIHEGFIIKSERTQTVA